MKEIRNTEQINTSLESESRTIEGYGIVFNSLSQDLGGFKEIISPSAITEETIRNSDILFLLDHNKERGVLARSKYGEGSLSISIDERGVKYSFDSPRTSLGDEVLEGLRRGDINKCSFAFVVGEDRWIKNDDGVVIRYIDNIKRLYDISIVYNPAYEETIVVNKRGLEEMEMEEDKDKEKKEDDVTVNDDESSEQKEDVVEEESEDAETVTSDDEQSENEDSDKEEEERNINETNLYNKVNNRNININMNKKFSLIKTINDVVNNRSLDEFSLNVIKEGRKAANEANVETNGQIVLALEKRAEGDTPTTPATPNGILATIEEQGKEAIPTNTFEIVEALRDKMVLASAGANFMSLQGNVEIPIYSGANCSWESEVGEAKDGSGKFISVKLSPKRLTATLPVSRQFLIQSSDSAEALLRNDLINCIAEKLQKTILGNGAGDSVTPKGMLNGVTADTAAFTYDDAVNMEAVLESNNIYGDYKYVMSPNAKAVMRTTSMDKGSGKFLYENNAVLGIEAESTNSVVNKGVILGDWKELIIAAFGALDIVVDPYTAAAKGQVILTVNAYFDYVERRPEAFVKRILK